MRLLKWFSTLLVLVIAVCYPMIGYSAVTDIEHETILNMAIQEGIPAGCPTATGSNMFSIGVSQFVNGSPIGHMWFGGSGNPHIFNYRYGQVSLFCFSPESLGHPGSGGTPTIITDPVFSHMFALANLYQNNQAQLGRVGVVARGMVLRMKNPDALIPKLEGSARDYYVNLINDFRTSDLKVISAPYIQTAPGKPLTPVEPPFEKDGRYYWVYDVSQFKGNTGSWGKGPFQPATVVSRSGKTYGPAITVIAPKSMWTSNFSIYFNGNEWGGPQGDALAEYKINSGESKFVISLPASEAPTEDKVVKMYQKHSTVVRGNADFNATVIAWKGTAGQNGGTIIPSFINFEIKMPPVDDPGGSYNVVKVYQDGCPNEPVYSSNSSTTRSLGSVLK